jgi:hypothetical protein
LCEEFAKVKELYESQLEEDTAKLFEKDKSIVLKSFEFHDRDKKGYHPDDLGNYDVICIDTASKTIWNIEYKYIGHIGSIFEYNNYQKGGF